MLEESLSVLNMHLGGGVEDGRDEGWT